MMDQTARAAAPNEHSIVITREFDAPLDLLWQVWNTPEHIEHWLGPEGFKSRVDSQDFRVGGKWNYVMIGPDGTEYPSVGVFQEIDEPRKVVSTDEFGEGFEIAGVELPQGIVTTVEFDDLGGRSRVTIKMSHPTPEDRKRHENMGVLQGWASTLDGLDSYLASLQKQRG